MGKEEGGRHRVLSPPASPRDGKIKQVKACAHALLPPPSSRERGAPLSPGGVGSCTSLSLSGNSC